jgi:hypothetical protein
MQRVNHYTAPGKGNNGQAVERHGQGRKTNNCRNRNNRHRGVDLLIYSSANSETPMKIDFK